ncbi:MAG: SMI1/KNR4 family protein, partial [Pseudomonas sp.]
CETREGYYAVAEDGEVLFWDGELTEESWDSVWDWVHGVWLEGD